MDRRSASVASGPSLSQRSFTSLDRVDWRAWLPTVIGGSRGRGAYGPEGIGTVPSHGTLTHMRVV
eukprot:scaffold39997_cov68-Phaeocystis_antarctica.AAC.1